VDLLLVRRLLPWQGNVRKRLVKSPKVYVRDSGLVHALLGIGDREALLAHPVAGASWEGVVIESLIAAAPNGAEACFFRTTAGAEIDLLLKLPGHRKPWAIEIKRGLAEADTAWRAAPDVPKSHGARLESRYRAARDAANRRLAELAAHASQARYDALLAAMSLCQAREGAVEATPDLEARWNAIEGVPDAWKPKLEARFRGGGAQASAPSASMSGARAKESLPELLLNLEAACGIDSPAAFSADRQRLKLLALKAAMEARRPVVTTAEDIERWLLDAAATPKPDETSRERLAKIIAAVRRHGRA